MLRLVMPKYVELKNRNLRVAFNVIQLLVIALMAFQLSTMVTWTNRIEISDLLDEDVWLEPVDLAEVQRVYEERIKSKLCTSPEDYVFRDGSKLHVKEGHSCLPPCGIPGAPAYPHCAHPAESVMQEAAHQLMFASEYEERWYGEGIDEGNASSHFTPYEDAYAIRFRYGFEVPQLSSLGEEFTINGMLGRLPNIRGVSDDYDPGENVKKILTVVVDQDDKPRRVHEPWDAPSVRLSIKEILEYSGAAEIMDEQNPHTGPNTHPHATQPDGCHRVTGLNIDVVIQCHLSQQGELPGRKPWVDPDTGQAWPVCYIKPKKSSTRVHAKWDQKDRVGANLRTRTGAGLRIRVISEGTFDFIDLNFALLQFTSSLVLLGLPRQIMFIFINYCIGHLSTIYRAVLIEFFDIQAEIARVTARLVSNSVTYVDLEDVDSEDDEETGPNAGAISQKRIEDQLRAVLQYRSAVLDEEEMSGLVRFCHHSMHSGAQFTRPMGPVSEVLAFGRSWGIKAGLISKDHAASLRFARKKTRTRSSKSENITIDDFSMCCAADSRLEFESFVNLFDKHRGITALESIFLPYFLRPDVLTAKAKVDRSPPPAMSSEEFGMYNLRQRHCRMRNLLEETKLSGEEAPGMWRSASVSKLNTLRAAGLATDAQPTATAESARPLTPVRPFAPEREQSPQSHSAPKAPPEVTPASTKPSLAPVPGTVPLPADEAWGAKSTQRPTVT